VGINGGIVTLEAVQAHLEHTDGVMLGRAAYQNPAILADADAAIFGDETVVDWNAVMAAMQGYAARHIREGGRLGQVARHMVGLFHGLPGARRFRQILSTEAVRPG